MKKEGRSNFRKKIIQNHSWYKMYKERFSSKSRVGTICDEERFSPKSRVGTINEEERHKKSLTSSPLYRSTLDSLVDEDNVVQVTEDLKVFFFSLFCFKETT